MAQHPTAPRPAAPTRPAEEPTQQIPASKPDLTVNKVLAGAGAAATSAVLGSLFGAAGTVAGAALGSVASTLATTVYQRSLDRTRDQLVARIRVTRGRGVDVASDESAAELTVPMPRVSPEGATTRLRVEPAVPERASRRRLLMGAGATVLVFVLAMLVVTGLEWAKGSTLTSGDTGTSVGRVLDGNRGGGDAVVQDPEPTTKPEPSSTPEPTTERSSEPAPTTEPEPTDSTTAPEPTGGSTAGPGSTADSGSTADPGVRSTPVLPEPLSPAG
jgi:hypothetical protein